MIEFKGKFNKEINLVPAMFICIVPIRQKSEKHFAIHFLHEAGLWTQLQKKC